MAQYGNKGSKNPPWARADQGGMGISNQMPQALMNANISLPNAAAAAMLQYPQQHMFQGQLGFQQQMYSNIGTVQYPTRALNSAVFQNSGSNNIQGSQSRSGETNKERVITGTVTKLQDNFGFVDDDIFFQLSCVTNGANNLRIGSRVLVEATFNPTMPFKWNAQRIQVLPTSASQNQQQTRGNYNAVPPPADNSSGGDRFGGNRDRFGNRGNQQQMQNKNKQSQGQQQLHQNRRPADAMRTARDRSLSADSDRRRRNDQFKRRRSSSRDKRTRTKSRSPVRKKRRAYVPRYNVQIPKYTLNNFETDVTDLKRKFSNMYVPSDFFLTRSIWQDSFPLDKPFNLDVPCKFHVFHKDVLPLKKPLPEPSDSDYLYSAKVILLASPGMEDLFKKCITLAEDSARSQSRSPEEDLTVPAKLISFLIGQRGKEPMAIGGAWSPSEDGEDPVSDPGVLIKTAIRTTKYQTGIDLSNCTHWFRFLEIHYSRGESVVKGKAVPARVETVVLFIPDVWSCLPTRPEWDNIASSYSKLFHRYITNSSSDDPDEKIEEDEDSKDEELIKKEPTHYSELDPKNMKVSDLRDELEARGLSPKGLKTQLIARLCKVIKQEADAEEQKEENVISDDELDYDYKPDEDEDKEKEDEKQKVEIDEKEKIRLEKLYKLPEVPQILVHPNPEIKSGKFNCIVASLYSLLNYRVEDNKEHSFELFLFAEMFNGMLNRDFSFNIYRSLYSATADKSSEDSKEKDDADKDKNKEKSKEDKKNEEEEKKEKEEQAPKREKICYNPYEDARDTKKDDKEKKEDKKDDKEKKDDREKKEDKKDDKKKEVKVKLKTIDPYLLLSFAYFDNTLCGYIVDKDLEDILSNLCLSLSRSQVKKLVQKVVTKDTLHYRKLTDKAEDEIEGLQETQPNIRTFITNSNREMLPKSSENVDKAQAEKLNSGFIMYNGSLIDVGKLMNQLERNEASRINTEKLYNKLVDDNNILRSSHDASVKTVKELTYELNTFKKRLSSSTNDLDAMSARVMRYVDVIFQIKKNIDPVIKENTPDEDFKTLKLEPDEHDSKSKDKSAILKDKSEIPVKNSEDKPSKSPDEKSSDKANFKKDVEDPSAKGTEDKSGLDKTEPLKTEKEEQKDAVYSKVESRDEEEDKDDVIIVKEEETEEDAEVDNETEKPSGETENNDQEQEEDDKMEGKAKPVSKRKAAVKEETPRRTPAKRAAAAPSTPKRKRN